MESGYVFLLFFVFSLTFLGEIYTSDKNGSDESGDGTEMKPFKTVLQAMRVAGKEPFPTIYVDAKEEGKVSKN
jgi:asparaginyl-tRNA synthetase